MTGPDLASAQAAFEAVPGYCNAATLGLPSRTTREALAAAVHEWATGTATATGYDAVVARARSLFAGLVDVPVGRVAVGSQASVAVGAVASSLPDGARVVVPAGDFTSVVFPFLVHAGRRGLVVAQVPLAGLADAVDEGCDLVAWSRVQSADGALADDTAVREAAARVGAATLCDLTQAAGWLPVRAGDYDVSVTAAYKWLCAPRGVCFTTVAPSWQERLLPTSAGWYAGEDVWGSVYGPAMALAGDARRFDVSPAWLAWAGAVPALEVFAGLDVAQVRDHDAALADAVLAGLDLPPAGRAVVTVPDPDGRALARLADAGVTAVARAGAVRLSFHLWNGPDDVERVLGALRG
ncbi:aminotransferase class V-fold PLP-dependent enzyme [Pseudokineococcus sp. 1T1Z-3]|uniref:aminotransferase class V-fold PLP-dependent enzyme n=1 Tax=Pseudokineococcus sp. 1T1Z-3 TaxID=3132745 RepID=UPI00309ABD27